jgi:hypothetical protein
LQRLQQWLQIYLQMVTVETAAVAAAAAAANGFKNNLSIICKKYTK